MPLVTPSSKNVIKLSFDEQDYAELDRYTVWAASKKSKVVEVALRRLFADDQEWIAQVSSQREEASK